VLDPVGGDRFTDSLRTLNPNGRLVVVGFTGGAIPEVKVNRLLLNNTAVVGSGWGAYITKRPETIADVAAKLDALIEAGHVRPLVGARFKLEDATQALQLIEARGATGKVVLEP
jgi:NADPH2:quinone reductase